MRLRLKGAALQAAEKLRFDFALMGRAFQPSRKHRKSITALQFVEKLWFLNEWEGHEFTRAASSPWCKSGFRDEKIVEFTGFVRRLQAWRWARASSGRSKKICGSRTRSWPRLRGIRFISV